MFALVFSDLRRGSDNPDHVQRRSRIMASFFSNLINDGWGSTRRRGRSWRCLVVSGMLAFGMMGVGLAQQVAQAPAPSGKAVEQEAAPNDPGDFVQANSPPAAGVLHVFARRVVEDLVVTDAQGQPVAGLSKDDFKVFEDGVPQRVLSFDAHAAEPVVALPKLNLPPNTYSTLSTAPESGPVMVILYDLLNTPLEAQPYARAQLLRFLKNRPESSQVAIFVLSDRLHMLQGFTNNDSVLMAALKRQNATYKSSDLQGHGEATQQSDELANGVDNQSVASGGQMTTLQAVSKMLTHMETVESSEMMDQRVLQTQEALEEIARFLVGLPGRKSLLWLSGAFPETILPNPSLGQRDSFGVTRSYSSTLVEATDLLNLAHVAVYPVDVRGLEIAPMYSAESKPTFQAGSGDSAKALANFSQRNDAEHATMDVIAQDTGGRAFYNTNGLEHAVATATKEGAMYYSLSYAPSDTKLDGGVRHVKIELLKPELREAGYQLSYRRTYFADNIDADVAKAEDHPNDALALTLEHGAPEAHQLFFEAHLATYGQPTAASPQQMMELAKYEALAADKKGRKAASRSSRPVMMQRYVIEYSLLLRQVQAVPGGDGTRTVNLDFAAMAFDEDGNPLKGIRSRVHDAIPPERYERLLKSGYTVVQTAAVPVQAAFLRVAVRDLGNSQMGSVEIQLPLAEIPQDAVGGVSAQHASPAKP